MPSATRTAATTDANVPNATAHTASVADPVAPNTTVPAAAAMPATARTAAAAVVPVTQSESNTESFGIQLGAFTSEGKANSEWQRLQSAFTDELGSLEPHIISASTSAGMLFRLQSRVENEAKAREVCAALAEKSQGCVVVLPQH
jgi:hypothetical protein